MENLHQSEELFKAEADEKSTRDEEHKLHCDILLKRMEITGNLDKRVTFLSKADIKGKS